MVRHLHRTAHPQQAALFPAPLHLLPHRQMHCVRTYDRDVWTGKLGGSPPAWIVDSHPPQSLQSCHGHPHPVMDPASAVETPNPLAPQRGLLGGVRTPSKRRDRAALSTAVGDYWEYLGACLPKNPGCQCPSHEGSNLRGPTQPAAGVTWGRGWFRESISLGDFPTLPPLPHLGHRPQPLVPQGISQTPETGPRREGAGRSLIHRAKVLLI